MKKSLFRMFSLISVLALMLAALPMQSARAAPTELFFSEYIEGSSNNKALEIYNGTGAAVNLATGGYSIQMFFNGSASAGLTINLTGTVANGDVYVVAQSSANATILAQADQTSSAGWFNGDDAVALRKGTTVIDVIGQIGFDPGTEWGTGLTSTADNTLRRKCSITAGDSNGSDAFDPSVEWDGFATDTFDGLGSHTSPCPVSTNPSGVGTATPSTISTGDTTLLTVAVTPGTNPTSTGLAVTADLTPSGGSATQAFYDNGTNGDVTAGDNTFSFLATATSPTACGASLSATITDAQGRQGSASIALTVKQAAAIHDIQGASHISPLSGKCLIDISGIVTAERSNGFYMEEPAANWDGDDSTSEGIFVFTSSAPAVNVGDGVVVTGTPQEFRPGGSTTANLTTTEISTPGRTVTVVSSGNTLPPAIIVGTAGRMPPTENIEDDATGDVETSGVFDPASDGIDFYESLEGMQIQLNDPVALGPTNGFGETSVVPDNGSWAGIRTARGGILLRQNDANPERLVLDDLFVQVPAMNVGDYLNGAVVGVLDYNFGNFFVEVTTNPLPPLVSGGLTQETATPAETNQIAVATFNVENLAPTDPPAKFARLAGLIVDNLQSPDVIAIEEIQDNNGVTDNGTVDASTTWGLLIAAISTAGGPTYQYRQIDPVNDQDGGAPGGNIRQGFLFRTDRGLSFIDRAGAGSTTANEVVGTGTGTQLLYSPGRIDPTNSAFSTSRKPLVAEFSFNGRHIFVIANHFNSKGGDNPLFGHFQPTTRISEVQRHQQAQVEHDFINAILTANPFADVITLGDLNDFEYSDTVAILKGSPVILNDLMDTLPQAERYSYVFEGNSQTLDQTLVSDNLIDNVGLGYDVVHVNSEFADQASDHEPQVTKFLTYLFSGFFQPVDNLPELNVAKAGSGIPVKFSLNGDKGLDIFAAGYPQSTKIACDSSEPQDAIEETVSPGSSGLAYDPTTDTYTYVWKTDKKWAGTCRQFVLRLNDGTFYRANFKFNK